MHFRHRLAWLTLVAALAAAALVVGQGTTREVQKPAKVAGRKLLYPSRAEDVPESLRPFVTRLLDPKQGTVDAADAKPSGVFARVVTRKYVLDGKGLKKGGMLGTGPFVFVTLPEALYDRSLLQVFSMIGYRAEDVLTAECGQEKVIVVFRWEKDVLLHPGRDGRLPEAWHRATYSTTWDNLFALVEKMASDRDRHYIKEKGKPRCFSKLEFRSAKEVAFVLGYPDAGKKRIKGSSYYALREVKGADWEYRKFLKRAMGAAEHFSGDGRSKPTILYKGKLPKGFPEFIGPNREVTALPEVAVIGLGALRIGE
jgi:hypothetical protein